MLYGIIVLVPRREMERIKDQGERWWEAGERESTGWRPERDRVRERDASA